jgi:hypothetical protein
MPQQEPWRGAYKELDRPGQWVTKSRFLASIYWGMLAAIFVSVISAFVLPSQATAYAFPILFVSFVLIQIILKWPPSEELHKISKAAFGWLPGMAIAIEETEKEAWRIREHIEPWWSAHIRADSPFAECSHNWNLVEHDDGRGSKYYECSKCGARACLYVGPTMPPDCGWLGIMMTQVLPKRYVPGQLTGRMRRTLRLTKLEHFNPALYAVGLANNARTVEELRRDPTVVRTRDIEYIIGIIVERGGKVESDGELVPRLGYITATGPGWRTVVQHSQQNSGA